MTSIPIPIPATLESATWFLIGLAFARGFGKKLDQEITTSEWFKKRHMVIQGILKRLLDSLHHYWVGLLLMTYPLNPAMYWFGLGIFIDDLPDIPRRYKKLFAEVKRI